MQIILLIVTVALPVTWLVADIRGGAAIRRTLGVIAILWSFGVAAVVGGLDRLNANLHFSRATKDLLEASVQQWRAGRSEAVIREWSRANDEFSPTYEDRAQYRQIVDRTVEGMKQ